MMNIISSLAALLGVSILHTCHADEQFYLSIEFPKKKVQDKNFWGLATLGTFWQFWAFLDAVDFFFDIFGHTGFF